MAARMSVLAHEALVLPVEPVIWRVSNRNDPAIVALADRHYSRQTRGSAQMGAPAASLAFVTPCQRAAWLSQWTDHPDDDLLALRCAFFRNEGAGLSSDLILAAMRLTEAIWPPEEMAIYPRDGWVTFVKPSEIESPNPGYCFKIAGWWTDHAWNPARGRRKRIRLRAELLGDAA
jgi:hypothetical protein